MNSGSFKSWNVWKTNEGERKFYKPVKVNQVYNVMPMNYAAIIFVIVADFTH